MYSKYQNQAGTIESFEQDISHTPAAVMAPNIPQSNTTQKEEEARMQHSCEQSQVTPSKAGNIDKTYQDNGPSTAAAMAPSAPKSSAAKKEEEATLRHGCELSQMTASEAETNDKADQYKSPTTAVLMAPNVPQSNTAQKEEAATLQHSCEQSQVRPNRTREDTVSNELVTGPRKPTIWDPVFQSEPTSHKKRLLAKTALEEQLEQVYQSVPLLKPKVNSMDLLPDSDSDDFLAMVGFEVVTNGWATGREGRPPLPTQCVDCKTDFTPAWNWVRGEPNCQACAMAKEEQKAARLYELSLVSKFAEHDSVMGKLEQLELAKARDLINTGMEFLVDDATKLRIGVAGTNELAP